MCLGQSQAHFIFSVYTCWVKEWIHSRELVAGWILVLISGRKRVHTEEREKEREFKSIPRAWEGQGWGTRGNGSTDSVSTFLPPCHPLQLFRSPEALLPYHDRVSQSTIPISHALVGKPLLSYISLFNFSSSGKKLGWCCLPMLFNLLDCQAKK